MSQPSRRPSTSRVRALLGPTNTGKTTLAIDRLLAHESGAIGFPLRLLARENYERMVARQGAARVALITGEEKIVPPGARWFACTVEAMPLDRPVEMLAVDEVQLCADPERGHLFTDRILHARGQSETLFLGAETVAPLLRALVPECIIETRPRLSQLTYAGVHRLARLPPRSAVVAFSAPEVYAMAEAIRRRRGGCAVVMGRLSPQTRNAQVALFQSKEVDFLVATDAIGMGLNMDLDHVAFGQTVKFDGQRPRPLAPPELAQVAGRAGRGSRDGTFGTLPTAAIAEDTVARIEEHRFDPLEVARWRNSALDFNEPAALLASLLAQPRHPRLQRAPDALDQLTLATLLREPEIARQAAAPARLRLLWEVCSIPDFRRLGDDSHARLCGRVFTHLVTHPGRLPGDWVARSLANLAVAEGDIDTLMQRLAGVRVWSYLAARTDWLADAPHWQGLARRTEDLLSDTLHQRLTARFVDRRAAHLIRRLRAGEPALLAAVTADDQVVVEGHSIGRLAAFTFLPHDVTAADDPMRTVARAARRALADETSRRLLRLEAAADAALALDPQHRLTWQQGDATEPAPIAILRAGAHPARPRPEALASAALDAAGRRRIEARARAWCASALPAELAPLARAIAGAERSADLRGLAHLLDERLGIVPQAALPPLPPDARPRLKPHGIVLGRFAAFVPALLKPRPAGFRARLLAIAAGWPPGPLPPAERVSLPADPTHDEATWLALGWLVAGPVRLRLDVAERIAAELGGGPAPFPRPVPAHLATRLSTAPANLAPVLHALGFHLRHPADGPAAYACRRRPRRRAEPPPAKALHPAFDALAALRRVP